MKAQQNPNSTVTTTSTIHGGSGTLRPKTNIMNKKKLLPEPKSLLLSKKKTIVPKVANSTDKKTDLETRPFSDSIVQSTLALVDSISMSSQLNTHNHPEMELQNDVESLFLIPSKPTLQDQQDLEFE